MSVYDVCLYFISPCCAQLSGNRHVAEIALYTILHFLLSYYHWKNNNRTPMVSHVNRPLTEQWLLMFTTCHCIRHIIIFSVLAALSPSPFFSPIRFFCRYHRHTIAFYYVIYAIAVLARYTHTSLHIHILSWAVRADIIQPHQWYIYIYIYIHIFLYQWFA